MFKKGVKRLDAALSGFTKVKSELELSISEIRDEIDKNKEKIGELEDKNELLAGNDAKASKALVKITELLG